MGLAPPAGFKDPSPSTKRFGCSSIFFKVCQHGLLTSVRLTRRDRILGGRFLLIRYAKFISSSLVNAGFWELNPEKSSSHWGVCSLLVKTETRPLGLGRSLNQRRAFSLHLYNLLSSTNSILDKKTASKQLSLHFVFLLTLCNIELNLLHSLTNSV